VLVRKRTLHLDQAFKLSKIHRCIASSRDFLIFETQYARKKSRWCPHFSQNSGGISATSKPQRSIFFYKCVAFFFERGLELAHQASESCFGNKTGITSGNVNDALGVQKQKQFAREANQPLVRRWLWQRRKKRRRKQL